VIGRLVALAVLLSAPAAVAAPEGAPPAGQAAAVFAGGCFWCMEGPFDALDGVISTTSGYTGGRVPDPSYEQVSEGATGHVEAVRVVYDPRRVDFAKLLDVFWHNVDPFDAGGQRWVRFAVWDSAGNGALTVTAASSNDASSSSRLRPVGSSPQVSAASSASRNPASATSGSERLTRSTGGA